MTTCHQETDDLVNGNTRSVRCLKIAFLTVSLRNSVRTPSGYLWYYKKTTTISVF